MKIDRKTFLRGIGLSALGAIAAPMVAREVAGVVPTLPPFDARAPEAFWRGVRALYPLADDPLYLNTG
ncbi:MAG TPA: hypothetical protein VL069_15010, partial [Opitutus sp.]|nr:hypothetical protein [Opitutus sp.]